MSSIAVFKSFLIVLGLACLAGRFPVRYYYHHQHHTFFQNRKLTLQLQLGSSDNFQQLVGSKMLVLNTIHDLYLNFRPFQEICCQINWMIAFSLSFPSFLTSHYYRQSLILILLQFKDTFLGKVQFPLLFLRTKSFLEEVYCPVKVSMSFLGDLPKYQKAWRLYPYFGWRCLLPEMWMFNFYQTLDFLM